MKIDQFVLLKLAEMICGGKQGEQFDCFPYRSSSHLTEFFRCLDFEFDYEHDGSTRKYWVKNVLNELNDKPQLSSEMPSRELIKIIENLLHPHHFLGEQNVVREKSIEAVMDYLKSNNLTIVKQPNGLVKVRPLQGELTSTKDKDALTEKLATFKPSVFEAPDKPQNDKLISVMMPFDAKFNDTYSAIEKVAEHMHLECLRADRAWENPTILQGIVDLIFRAKIIVVDFTGSNPNVLYETGIAHTFRKIVIPIARSTDDIPSDLSDLQVLPYLPNEQGYQDLGNKLCKIVKICLGTGST